jgi:nitric oxide reductase activation protein
MHPQVTKTTENNYKRAYEVVQDTIASMKAVFRLRLGVKKFRTTELTEGRMHRKMLSKAPMTDRIFSREYIKKAQGLSVCLIMDESGSMGGVSSYGHNKADRALQVAVCCAEALKGVAGIELEVYSYGSSGNERQDNLMKVLYSSQENTDTKSIGGYCGSSENYDHMAIKMATSMFLKKTTNDKKLMIVLSDGRPSGHRYGGESAMKATRDAVNAAEKKGIYVLNVAIENYASERMFKHVLRFTDIPNLIPKMRNLIVSLVRSVS